MIATRSRGVASYLVVALLLGAVLGTAARADLVGLYRFENPNNPGKDSSPSGNDLSAFGGWASDPNGQYGQGLAFNGVDAVLAIDDGTGKPEENRLPDGCPYD